MVAFLNRVVEGQPTKQQIGEEIGVALLFGSRIVGAEAACSGGEHAVDSGGVSG